ncbi:hydroxyethylthiazole kinase [Desulfovibrio legallii]|uniref:Hydroxyethylthiazole kinase n=1 Tax=Desulfovibrio legallii TaxID=571438 RepID=A0A1G7J228_9BACT|nr:hydroxyethylthiazole kinase [Desulfovibrio legallii]SDF18980.1 hydroxyethylthiazole kinase [Desulfovibrio legallii]
MNGFAEILDDVRRQVPVVHSITNYVTVNDCANVILALGGSAIMADDADEVEQIAGLSAALVINIGTLNQHTIPAMLAAGKRANALGRPVVLDPVGAGASDLRNDTLARLLGEVRFAAIKGNSAEIRFLAGSAVAARGVDAGGETLVTEANLEASARMAAGLSARTGAAVVVSGPIDLVAFHDAAWAVRNGDAHMAGITGAGCMAAAATGCCLGAAPDKAAEACLCAMAAMGVAGEMAAEQLIPAGGGLGSFRTLLLDALGRLDGPALAARVQVESVF